MNKVNLINSDEDNTWNGISVLLGAECLARKTLIKGASKEKGGAVFTDGYFLGTDFGFFRSIS